MDRVDRKTRSRIMASIRSKNTKPEMIVRKLAHRLGYRFRIHRRDLPGTPDLVFPKYQTVIQVNGCFWHGHHECEFANLPRSNTEFWSEKIEANRARDLRTTAALNTLGWTVLAIWNCEMADEASLISKLHTAMPREPRTSADRGPEEATST